MRNKDRIKADALGSIVNMTRWWSCNRVIETQTHLKVRLRDTQSNLVVTDNISKKSGIYLDMYKQVFGINHDLWSGQSKPGQLHLINESGKSYARFVFTDPQQ